MPSLDLNVLDPKMEIVLKKVQASLLQGLGFNTGFKSLLDIQSHSFVASDPQCPSKTLPDPEISEQNITIMLGICRRLIFAKKSKTFDPEVSEKDVNKFLAPAENIHPAFHPYSVWDLQYALFAGLRNETLDSFCLRYIVARKLDVSKLLQMLLKCLDWRKNVHPVDSYIYESDVGPYRKGTKMEMIDAFKINQVYLRGFDIAGRPLVIVQVCRHFRPNCPDKDFEQLICLIIEWARLRIQESKGIDKGTVLFDMSGFTLKNADLYAVKFLTTAFEANYPEYLGAVCIHKAPWIFAAVWKIIRPWLDPRIACKIHFTHSFEDLKQFISPKYIPQKLGGEDAFDAEYVPPSKKDSSTKPVERDFEVLFEEYVTMWLQYIESTVEWIHAKTGEESQAQLNRKLKYQRKLPELYVKLDPYVRAPGVAERCGEMTEIGL